ncbi:MAG: 2-C-methyl-D-erythritol 4-phosphate cytidylyltransferase [Lysobacterales bacterium]
MSTASVHVLIPAAGTGARYGGATLKQYLPLCGKAVMAHSINAFRFHPMISSITVILAENDQFFESALGALTSAVNTVTGGETREHSVRNGLRYLAENYSENDWALVHDAARPCLSASRLERFLEQGLASASGAILAVPVGDTLKRGGDSQEIIATVDRNGLWAAQTPQLFRIGALASAIDAAHAAGCELTDEASAMEFVGVKPLLVMGSAANIKITYSSDLAIAEALLARNEVSS